VRDLTYPAVVMTAKTVFKILGIRFQMRGTENVPRTGVAVLAFNHVSYVDFVFGGFAAQPSKRLVRFMAKKEIFDHRYAGPLMRSLHHIPVDRSDGMPSYERALEYLAAGEIVGLFPEATKAVRRRLRADRHLRPADGPGEGHRAWQRARSGCSPVGADELAYRYSAAHPDRRRGEPGDAQDLARHPDAGA
jgi:1-acyl-sn-glycerol-3-phosphate acyltransferase